MKFLTAKFLVQCYRVLQILYLPVATSSSIIIAFEEMNDEGSDT